MPKFDMNAGGGSRTASELRWVELKHIHADERNSKIYSTDNIEGLVLDIAMNGLIEPPTVRDVGNGEYTIISGHRRVLAMKELVKQGHSEYSRVPVVPMVDNDELSVAIKLISANAESRVLTNKETLAQAQEYMKLMKILKGREKLTGRTRDIVAKKLQISTGKLGELLAMSNNIIPRLLESYEEGIINLSVAVELSKLPVDDQILYAEWVENGREVSLQQVRHYRKSLEEEAAAEKAALDKAACPSMFDEPLEEIEATGKEPEPDQKQDVPKETPKEKPKEKPSPIPEIPTEYNGMNKDIQDMLTAMVMIKNACQTLSSITKCHQCPLFRNNVCGMINRSKPSYHNWLDGIQL